MTQITVQHTLVSDDESLVLDLPRNIHEVTARFNGPDAASFRQFFAHRPRRVSIWSGTAVVRYRQALNRNPGMQWQNDGLQISSSSHPEGLELQQNVLIQRSLSWLLPDALLIDGFSSSRAEGEWLQYDHALNFQWRGRDPLELTIRLRRREGAATPPQPSLASEVPAAPNTVTSVDTCRERQGDLCLDDRDSDGIADVWDVCIDQPALSAAEPPLDSRPMGLFTGLDPDVLSADDTTFTAALGCAGGYPLTLDAIRFRNGKSDLDRAARQQLHRLGSMLQQLPSDMALEIAAYTDAGGARSVNRSLSQQRAETVRQYLLLRGLGPNQVVARGHGEAQQQDAPGKSAPSASRRRIEVRLLK